MHCVAFVRSIIVITNGCLVASKHAWTAAVSAASVLGASCLEGACLSGHSWRWHHASCIVGVWSIGHDKEHEDCIVKVGICMQSYISTMIVHGQLMSSDKQQRLGDCLGE